MCVLVLSYKPETAEVSMGHVVGTYYGDSQAKFCTSGEEAIEHVAYLNAFNEPGAADYEHWFVYPDAECPWKEKDQETGEITYQDHCIPMSQADINLEDDEGGIPEHLRAAIEAREKEYRVRAQDARKRQQEAEERRRKEEYQKDLERQYEYLKEKLGK